MSYNPVEVKVIISLTSKVWLRWSRICPQCRRTGFDPWVRRDPGGGHGNPLQDACLENPTDRGAWRATVHGVAKSQTRLSD